MNKGNICLILLFFLLLISSQTITGQSTSKNLNDIQNSDYLITEAYYKANGKDTNLMKSIFNGKQIISIIIKGKSSVFMTFAKYAIQQTRLSSIDFYQYIGAGDFLPESF
ncbi:MAG: hypothetical protein HC905_02725 [Bacteroidales bacterium]|nr:hypothetical protein [Bacteroidales bacterium]